jgi:hypothetical protein
MCADSWHLFAKVPPADLCSKPTETIVAGPSIDESCAVASPTHLISSSPYLDLHAGSFTFYTNQSHVPIPGGLAKIYMLQGADAGVRRARATTSRYTSCWSLYLRRRGAGAAVRPAVSVLAFVNLGKFCNGLTTNISWVLFLKNCPCTFFPL